VNDQTWVSRVEKGFASYQTSDLPGISKYKSFLARTRKSNNTGLIEKQRQAWIADFNLAGLAFVVLEQKRGARGYSDTDVAVTYH
jgi:hypothetical protein